jgi:hypothetical protein
VITNPSTRAETALLCLLAVALVVGYLIVRRRQGHHIPVPVALALALLASAVATAPLLLWTVVDDAVHAKRYSAFEAERTGPEDNGVDTRVVDRIGHLIPIDATYEILLAPQSDPAARGASLVWTLTALLPRVAVEDPAKADWFVSFGGPPSTSGIRAHEVRVLRSLRGNRMSVWIGRGPAR